MYLTVTAMNHDELNLDKLKKKILNPQNKFKTHITKFKTRITRNL